MKRIEPLNDSVGYLEKITINPIQFAHDVVTTLNSIISAYNDSQELDVANKLTAKPGGLDSGEALRTYHNIETERRCANPAIIRELKRWSKSAYDYPDNGFISDRSELEAVYEMIDRLDDQAE